MTKLEGFISRADFSYIQRLLAERSGLVLDDDKAYLLETRLAPLLTRERFPSIGALVGELKSRYHDALAGSTVEALLNHETAFFRDQPCFDALREVILPRLIANAPDGKLTVWCAACSTGQEPYSIALLLAEHFPWLDEDSVRILGTDFSQAALDLAERARYSRFEVNRGLPKPILHRYFDEDGETWELRPEIRRRVEWQRLNLIEPWPYLPAPSLLLLRNTMIYWGVETQRAVLGRVHDLLWREGYLLLGGAESTFVDERFTRAPDLPCGFRLGGSSA